MCALWTLALLMLLVAPAAGAVTLELDARGLDAAQEARAAALLARLPALLPPAWRAAPQRLTLRFDPALRPPRVGHYRRGTIRLAPALLAAPPATGIDPALAALVHEIAHALDRGANSRDSRDPAFRRLAGWDRRGRGNPYGLRSPDARERYSPAEAFAVNSEWWLLDADYRCRRPRLAAWYAARFGAAPGVARTCPATLPFLEAGTTPSAFVLADLDPARVVAVDYLLAGSGEGMAGRFGHAMLRLVVCAAGHAPGPACRRDLAAHRVLSFRAFVDDVAVSNWRGLVGSYPARLYVLPLPQVIESYNRVELRDLRAYPLRLDAAEIAALLAAAARTHWSYDGRYRFIGNNCATETGRLLDLALAPGAGPRFARMTPHGVLAALRRAGRIALPDDPDTVPGLVFPSARADDERLLALLARAGLVRPMPLERWLDSPAAVRGVIPADLALRPSAAWWVLERAALRRAEQRALGRLKRTLAVRQPETTALAAGVERWLADARALAAPAALLDGPGYGLPQADEEVVLRRRLAAWRTRGTADWQALRAAGEAALPAAEQAELAATRARIAALGAHLRTLAGAGQGAE